MHTRMSIGLTMFQIGNQPVVSHFFIEMMMLVGATRNNQLLHYQAQK